MNPLRALLAALQKSWSRRAARRLLGQHLPTGISEPHLPLAVRVPHALDDAPEGEFWTLPLGAQAIRGRRPSLLLRLRALPPAPRRLEVLRPSLLRLDAETARPANEGIVPLERRDTTYRWVRPAFRREKLDLPWMAQERIKFLGPMHAEWFQMWWDEAQARRPGGNEPRAYDLPYELELALEQVKEQMLIRRDVKKDESPPEAQEFYFVELGQPIAALDTPPLTELVPPKQWVQPAEMLPPLPFGRAARDAYLRWRTLVDALEER